MKCSIVVGYLFGDEGKGITTDFLCSKSTIDDTIVVRFSGGQQAGHNVKIKDVTHVHSNYGSGTLRGVPSYFSEHCTVYPVTLFNETKVLQPKIKYIPKLIYHPLVKITTPADVAYNRLTELKLGHGSCGLGVAATMKRNETSGHKLFAIDLTHPEILFEKCKDIYWYYRRLIGEDPYETQKFNEFFDKEQYQFENAIDKLSFDIKSYEILKYYKDIIFEGSQGIMLDMDHGIFPHVTYSNTTSKNALEICKKLNVPQDDIDIYYVTRCYQTRHGAGWMTNQNEYLLKPVELINTEDEINQYNDWQKDFRIGEIDYELLYYAHRVDSIYSEGIRKNLVVTCLDQRPGFEFQYNELGVSYDKIFHSFSADSRTFKEIPK